MKMASQTRSVIVPRIRVSDNVAVMQNRFPNAQRLGLDHSSIRDNILFGSPLNESRYAEVIRCCGLSALPTLFKAGDQTDIRLRDVNIDASVNAR